MAMRSIVQKVTTVSLNSFRQKSEGRQVILLYPWTNYKNLFLTYYLSSHSDGLLYHRVSSSPKMLREWLGSMVDEFTSVLGNFGSQVNDNLNDARPAELALMLIADILAASGDKPVILFIDELDNITPDADFHTFVRAFVEAMPESIQLAISSRMLTHEPWYEMVRAGIAVVLGTDQRKNDMMFTIEEQPKPQLEVFAFGRGHGLVNGSIIQNWDGALPRNLFFFFMDHPLVTRDEVFQAFWPALGVKDATNVFHVTKRKITERITAKVRGYERDSIPEGEQESADETFELTQYSNGYYLPSDKIVRHYDVADFVEAIDKAMVASSEREEIALLGRAIDLYKAPFLQTIDMPWVVERREQLRQMYAQALIQLGRIYYRKEDKERALGFFTRSLKENPQREDVHRLVMGLYRDLHMIEDAIAQYAKLKQVLKEVLGIEPSRETRQLYDEIEKSRR